MFNDRNQVVGDSRSRVIGAEIIIFLEEKADSSRRYNNNNTRLKNQEHKENVDSKEDQSLEN